MYRKLYNDFFSQNGDNIHYDPIRMTELAKLCRGRVLDLGCGTGDLLDFYSGEYVGVDVSDVALEMAKNKHGFEKEFICLDLTKETLNVKGAFDTVILAEFLEHIKDDEFDITSLREYLKPNGRIVISVPFADRIPDKDHVREFTIPKLRQMFGTMGKVRFYNWAGADRRIIMTCDIGESTTINNSLCMILKNEEKGLERCIMSAISMVDEIVLLVDDSSTDKTLEIAKLLGDTVETYTWQNDFSAARNLCQSKIKGKWAFHLDGHEFITQINFDDFSDLLEYDGIYTRIEYEHGLSFRHPRIVRKDVLWRDKVHNSVLCTNVAKKVACVMLHDRENLQDKKSADMRAEQRNEMISTIMSDRIHENKKDTRALFYYGVHKQSQKEYFRAIKLYKQYLKYSVDTGERWYATLNMAVCYMLAGKSRRAFFWAQMTEKEIPGRWENAHLCAVVLMQFERYEPALQYLVSAMKDDTRAHTYNPIVRDIGEIWDMLGTCFVNLNQFAKARVAFERAIASIKDDKKREMIQGKYSALNVIEEMSNKTMKEALVRENDETSEQSLK